MSTIGLGRTKRCQQWVWGKNVVNDASVDYVVNDRFGDNMMSRMGLASQRCQL